MQRKKYRLFLLLAALWLMLPGTFAQYKVTGGSKTPLMASDDTRNRIQVYLVYGTDNVEISYTSSSTSHLWYRYKTKALEAERVQSTQQGTTSTIRGIEDGYGYFVQEAGELSRYVWIIDYSRHAFDISSLEVNEGSNPCSTFRLKGAATNTAPLPYYAPVGTPMQVQRSFDVSYSTLEWTETMKRFSRKEEVKTVEGDPFAVTYPAPLTDTYIRLSGDAFARYFGVEKSTQTADYTAIAIEAHADTTVLSQEPTYTTSSDELSAPITIRFTGYANDPVAGMYVWKLIKRGTDGGKDEEKLNYTGEEVEFEFKEAGEYYVQLEVSNRSGNCTDMSNSFDFKVSDYFIDMPNAFSPGSTPGVNDEFRVIYRSIYNFKGWIFNRWGAEVFHWTNPDLGWDGKKGGKYVAPGVYYYVIEFQGSDGKKYKRSGDINILRPKTIDDVIQ